MRASRPTSPQQGAAAAKTLVEGSLDLKVQLTICRYSRSGDGRSPTNSTVSRGAPMFPHRGSLPDYGCAVQQRRSS